jgi:LemA protein
MRKWILPIIIILFVFILYSWVKGFYNTAITLKNAATKEWGNVESAYQRRADLIPNLVETVKGYAAHEQETLQGVIEARANASKVSIDPTNITPEKLAEFQQAQQGISGALNRLMVVVERYPDLKANQNFIELQSQLEGTENRINVARDRYNERIEPYKNHLEKFPGNMLAGIFNLKPLEFFKSEAGAEKAPKVDFSK